MSESIAEMVIPGTYIEVRAEGLISVGGISTGTIGIVGTAGRGPVDTVVAIGSLAEAVDVFGAYDPFGSPRQSESPLTLVRALEQAFGGGARNVLAVRVANGDPVADFLEVEAAGDRPAFTLTAKEVTGPDGTLVEGSSGTWGRDTLVSVVSDGGTPAVWRMTLHNGSRREVYEGASVGDVAALLAGSALVTVGTVENPTLGFTPVPTAVPLGGGTDGANVVVTDIAAGLAALETESVNLLLVAGLGADTIGTAVQTHVSRTESEGRERIALIGARAPGSSTAAPGIDEDLLIVSDDRIVLVAPGLVTTEASGAQVTLPPSYLAAVVAGALSTLAPHVSLTNKVVPAVPDVRYSSPLLSSLLTKHVLVVRQKYGPQVVKAITTDGGAFKQISIRRTVDYAKAGVRQGSDPYIGKLNNSRVRAALKATLDGFLSQMVLDEMLVDYSLDVSATRAQERAGICAVGMTLRPTFSIDYIRVTMNLE